jgi:predicted O-methyltransferase YrrM
MDLPDNAEIASLDSCVQVVALALRVWHHVELQEKFNVLIGLLLDSQV